MSTPDSEELLHHKWGSLRKKELVDAEINAAWKQLMASEVGRKQIAAALEVSPDDVVHIGKAGEQAPFETSAASGFDAATLIIVLKWVATTVVVPVLIDLTKDELKRRFSQLWRDVLVPAIRGKKQNSLGDYIS